MLISDPVYLVKDVVLDPFSHVFICLCGFCFVYIRTLIKLVKSSDSKATKKAANDVGIALFYHLTTFFNTETKFYPPTRQFFTACIEILGQVSFLEDGACRAK